MRSLTSTSYTVSNRGAVRGTRVAAVVSTDRKFQWLTVIRGRSSASVCGHIRRETGSGEQNANVSDLFFFFFFGGACRPVKTMVEETLNMLPTKREERWGQAITCSLDYKRQEDVKNQNCSRKVATGDLRKRWVCCRKLSSNIIWTIKSRRGREREMERRQCSFSDMPNV